MWKENIKSHTDSSAHQNSVQLLIIFVVVAIAEEIWIFWAKEKQREFVCQRAAFWHYEH